MPPPSTNIFVGGDCGDKQKTIYYLILSWVGGEKLKISDFSAPDGYGLCCTSEHNGKEFVLSWCFKNGPKSVREAVDMVVHAYAQGGPIAARYGMIESMVKMEARTPGMLVTGKGNGAIATIKREWDIKRNLARDKIPVVMDLVMSLAALQMKENAKHA